MARSTPSRSRRSDAGGRPLRLLHRFSSRRDPGVRKYVFADGERLLEIGFYPGGRPGVVHLCFSCQWGCRMGCAFCATARLRQAWRGDLGVTAAQCQQMADQILLDPVNRRWLRSLREIGFDWMGMGEPGDNLEQVIAFMRRWRPPRPHTRARVLFRVNTIGVLAAIDRLATVDVAPARLKLYLSVHAVRDRSALIPYDRTAPLATVVAHATRFRRRHPDHLPVALNYLVLPGRNDAAADVDALLALADPATFYLRLCNLNAVDSCPPGLRRARRAELQRFAQELRRGSLQRWRRPLRVDLFESRGLDIEVGCGQLCGRLRAR